MKNKLIKIFLSVSVVSVIITSCQKKLDDAYANPNALTVEPIEGIFPSLIGSIIGSSAASGSAYGLAGDALLIGRYIQYWGTNTYTAASTTSANASN